MREYRFLDFVLQVEQRRLLGPDGRAVELSPRHFDTLLFFVLHAGELLDKDRLLSELWPGLVVEENSLSQSVSALRRALGDDAQRSRFIQTVPRRGFRFIALVATFEPLAARPDESPPAAPSEMAATAREMLVNLPAPATPARSPTPPTPPILSTPAIPQTTPATSTTLAASHVPPVSPTRRIWVGAVVGGVAVAAAAGAAWTWRTARRPSAAPGASRTLAVLPFRSIVAGSGDEMLEIGMAESLVSRLSNLPGVAVRSVSSVRRYRGADQDPIGAARELAVTWIVDGSVQRVGARVRVSSRLLNTTTGEAAWSGSFDEDYTDVFALQDSISTKVAQVLAPRLERDDRRRLAGAGGTRHVDAYQLYLAARQNAQGIKTAGLAKSIDLYRQAIRLDPSYALAWSGLAESYRRMVFGADGAPRVVLAESTRASLRAVELDPGSADAHAGIGWNRFWLDWDWDGARAAFERALALNASEANAHFGFSQLLEAQGRGAEALDHLRQARESDPMSLILLTLESGSLIGAGRLDEGRERLQRVFDIDPDFWVACMVQSVFHSIDGRPDEALASMSRADRLSDGSSQPAAALGHMLARRGQSDQARVVLQRLLDLSKTRYVPPTSTGLIYAGLGDKAATLGALEAGYADRDVRMTLVWHDRRWRVVADDPRFAALRRQMKLG